MKTTIYTIAEELGMTPSMVSRAFNPNAKISGEKRRVILELAEKYNFSPNRMASRLSMKTVRVGILINSRFSVNTDKMLFGISDAWKKARDYKIEYEITLLDPREASMSDYAEALSGYRDFDGVIITGMSSPKYTDIINDFYRKNPNIVQVQAINMDAEYLFASKHDEVTASSVAAEFLYNCLRRNEHKNILLFTGEKESSLHASAEASFKDACCNFGLNLLESINMMDSEECLEKILPDIFERYKDAIDGIYITSGFSVPLCRFIEENKLDLPLVAFDKYDEIAEYMKKGIISATVSQNVSGQMSTAFEMLVKYLITGEKFPKIVNTDVELILKSNMHQFD